MEYRTVKISDLHRHEKVIPEKCRQLHDYITSTHHGVISTINSLPYIVIDISTNVIIDGHHRYCVFQELLVQTITVLAVDYLTDERILVHPTNTTITKTDVISSALSGRLYEPKTTKHMITTWTGELLPIIYLGGMVD